MARIYVPSTGPHDWQRLLAKPDKHWKPGFSAMALAHAWEEAGGLPAEIANLFNQEGGRPELLIGLPEHKVPLPGSSRGESQNDLFALIRNDRRTFAVAVEGKVDEPFGPTMAEWLVNASGGKRERIAFICDVLRLPQPLSDDVHYQLLHRTASAVIEARRFKTDAAAMLVHSFSPSRRWFDAFARFVALFGVEAEAGKLLPVLPEATPPLYVGWVSGEAVADHKRIPILG